MAKKSSLKILIAYEDLDAGVRAKKISERVAEQLNFNYHFQCDLFKFDFLDHPELREEATLQASAADLVFISTNVPGELPGHVKSWIEDWLPCRRKGRSALVALLGNEDADSWGSNLARDYLQQMADRGHMDFFCKTDWPEEMFLSSGRPDFGIEGDTSVPAEISADSSWRGWGNND